MKKLFRFILVFLLLGIIGIGVYRYLWRANDPMNGQKADYQVLAHEWVEEFKINEQAANQKYLGRIVEAKGVVREVLRDSLGPKLTEVGNMLGSTVGSAVTGAVESAQKAVESATQEAGKALEDAGKKAGESIEKGLGDLFKKN